MNAGQLRKMLEGVPDDTPVLRPGGDHSYGPARAEVTTALREGRGWTEDHGEDVTPEAEYGPRTQVVVIG